MSRESPSPPPWPAPRALVREFGLGVLALVGVAIVVAAVMVGLILLLYAPH